MVHPAEYEVYTAEHIPEALELAAQGIRLMENLPYRISLMNIVVEQSDREDMVGHSEWDVTVYYISWKER